MGKEIYSRRIAKEKIEAFGKILQENGCFEDFLGAGWINSNICEFFHDRKRIHPLFWKILLDNRFPVNLKLLENSYGRFQSLINQLKSDVKNFKSLTSNIDIYCEYKRKHENVSFRPQNEENNKECDVRLTLDSSQYWGEIFTIDYSEQESEDSELYQEIRLEFNERNQSDNCVSVVYCAGFSRHHKDKLINFLLDESRIASLLGEQVLQRELVEGEIELCKVMISRRNENLLKGCYLGSVSPVREDNGSIRIKNKLRNKLDGFQFPHSRDIFKFFIIVILDRCAEIDDIESAILGQVCFSSSLDGNFIVEGKHPNGIVHDLERQGLWNDIDFIIIKIGEEKYYKVKDLRKLEFIKKNF